MAHCLLEQGASPQLRSEFDDLTPLQAARRHGRTALVQRLLELGAQESRPSFWRRWLPF